jgi:DNA modification methylase
MYLIERIRRLKDIRDNEWNRIVNGDCLQGLKKLKDDLIHCTVTSPPYWSLRDYKASGQIGMEYSPEKYLESLEDIFAQVHRITKPDGVLWLNLDDVYWDSDKAGRGQLNYSSFSDLKDKDLMGLPWLLALRLRKMGWYLRQDIIWHKPNPMPESIRDRCTKAHEYIFLFSKGRRYYYDHETIKTPSKLDGHRATFSKVAKKGVDEPLVNCFRKQRGPYLMANRRSVWSIATRQFAGAHFATFPPEVPELCILAGSREGDIILDPFMGAGTTALVAAKLNRRFLGYELNPDYVRIAEERLRLAGIDIERAMREN